MEEVTMQEAHEDIGGPVAAPASIDSLRTYVCPKVDGLYGSRVHLLTDPEAAHQIYGNTALNFIDPCRCEDCCDFINALGRKAEALGVRKNSKAYPYNITRREDIVSLCVLADAAQHLRLEDGRSPLELFRASGSAKRTLAKECAKRGLSDVDMNGGALEFFRCLVTGMQAQATATVNDANSSDAADRGVIDLCTDDEGAGRQQGPKQGPEREGERARPARRARDQAVHTSTNRQATPVAMTQSPPPRPPSPPEEAVHASCRSGENSPVRNSFSQAVSGETAQEDGKLAANDVASTSAGADEPRDANRQSPMERSGATPKRAMDKAGMDEGAMQEAQQDTNDDWLQCDRCGKWRLLRCPPQDRSSHLSAERWYCEMNPDASHATCEAPQEASSSDEEDAKELAPVYAVHRLTDVRTVVRRQDGSLVLARKDHRDSTSKCFRQFFVHWKGYDVSESTWEDEDNILDRALIDAFDARHGGGADGEHHRGKPLAKGEGGLGGRGNQRTDPPKVHPALERVLQQTSAAKRSRPAGSDAAPRRAHSSKKGAPIQWIQCDRCTKWRVLRCAGPLQALLRSQPSWHCELNPDDKHNACTVPQESEDSAMAAAQRPPSEGRVGLSSSVAASSSTVSKGAGLLRAPPESGRASRVGGDWQAELPPLWVPSVAALAAPHDQEPGTAPVRCRCGDISIWWAARWWCARGSDGCGFEAAPPPGAMTPLCHCGERAVWVRTQWLCSLHHTFGRRVLQGGCDFELRPEPSPQEPVRISEAEIDATRAAWARAFDVAKAARSWVEDLCFIAHVGDGCGLGLVARVPLRPDQVITEYGGPRLPLSLLEEGRGEYALEVTNTQTFIDGSWDNSPLKESNGYRPRYPAIFANHSSSPNARFERRTVATPYGSRNALRFRMLLVASERIPPGGEIRIDYECGRADYWQGRAPLENDWRSHYHEPPPPPHMDDEPRPVEWELGAAEAPPLTAKGGTVPWEGVGGGDERLRLLVPLLDWGNPSDWPLIASHLPGRTVVECRARWVATQEALASRAAPSADSATGGKEGRAMPKQVEAAVERMICQLERADAKRVQAEAHHIQAAVERMIRHLEREQNRNISKEVKKVMKRLISSVETQAAVEKAKAEASRRRRECEQSPMWAAAINAARLRVRQAEAAVKEFVRARDFPAANRATHWLQAVQEHARATEEAASALETVRPLVALPGPGDHPAVAAMPIAVAQCISSSGAPLAGVLQDGVAGSSHVADACAAHMPSNVRVLAPFFPGEGGGAAAGVVSCQWTASQDQDARTAPGSVMGQLQELSPERCSAADDEEASPSSTTQSLAAAATDDRVEHGEAIGPPAAAPLHSTVCVEVDELEEDEVLLLSDTLGLPSGETPLASQLTQTENPNGTHRAVAKRKRSDSDSCACDAD